MREKIDFWTQTLVEVCPCPQGRIFCPRAFFEVATVQDEFRADACFISIQTREFADGVVWEISYRSIKKKRQNLRESAALPQFIEFLVSTRIH